jgi:hypothetical protein
METSRQNINRWIPRLRRVETVMNTAMTHGKTRMRTVTFSFDAVTGRPDPDVFESIFNARARGFAGPNIRCSMRSRKVLQAAALAAVILIIGGVRTVWGLMDWHRIVVESVLGNVVNAVARSVIQGSDLAEFPAHRRPTATIDLVRRLTPLTDPDSTPRRSSSCANQT